MIKEIDGNIINIERKKIRYINLKVTKNGKIKVSAPYLVSEKSIIDFVTSKKRWIEKHKKLVENSTDFGNYYKDGKTIIWGKSISVITEIAKSNSFIITDDILTIKVKNNNVDLEKYVKSALKLILINKISERLPKLEELTKLYSTGFRVRDMKTRWGSCNIKTKKLCFNLRLIQKEKSYLDYIIIHELGHIKIAGHDKRFYKYMSEYYPNYKEINKQINKN